jgi:SAM-dependent methyltransferase
MNIREYNRAAWDNEVERANRWTAPVSSDVIDAARLGHWEVLLTENKPVPQNWFPDLKTGLDVLCLASGGGQQAPILAAAGANVTVFDNSPKQLAQDRFVAERDNLKLATVEGDMANLSMFSDKSFDLIFHPCSNCFVPELRPVWLESFRVLRSGGLLLSGFNNPALYIFDQELAERKILQVKHQLPYSDLASLSDEERRRYTDKGEPLEFSHTLSEQISGQTDAGFVIAGFYEDRHSGHPLAGYMPTYIATRAIKL